MKKKKSRLFLLRISDRDIVLLCFLNTLGGFFGGPWICAATVRGVAHVGALTVMSTNHAPGEAPHIVEVKGISELD